MNKLFKFVFFSFIFYFGYWYKNVSFPQPIKLTATMYNCNIAESGVKHQTQLITLKTPVIVCASTGLYQNRQNSIDTNIIYSTWNLWALQI
jgi:hypothetical protein